MRIAICDDRMEDSARLSALLRNYLDENALTANVDIFASGEALLEAAKPGKYQIIFQDIYMDKNGVTGMQAAEIIRERDDEVSIIFTTTSIKHGPASYAVDAAYYIVKPVEKENLRRALGKCRAQLDSYARMIEITVNRQPHKIRLRDVYYAEVFRHDALLRTVSGVIKSRITFGELVELLGGFPFIPCHRSYVVNIAHVADLRGSDFIMKNGDKAPISKTYQEQAQKAFKEFFWEPEMATRLRGVSLTTIAAKDESPSSLP